MIPETKLHQKSKIKKSTKNQQSWKFFQKNIFNHETTINEKWDQKYEWNLSAHPKKKKRKLSFTGNIVIFSLKKESLTETNPIIIKDCIGDKSKIENCIKINQSPAVQDKGSNLYNIIYQYLMVNMKKKLINS